MMILPQNQDNQFSNQKDLNLAAPKIGLKCKVQKIKNRRNQENSMMITLMKILQNNHDKAGRIFISKGGLNFQKKTNGLVK